MDTPIENAGKILKNDNAYDFHEINDRANIHFIFKLGGLDNVYAKKRSKMGRIAIYDADLGRRTLILANNYEVIDLATGAVLIYHTRALRKGSTEFIGAEYVAGLAEHENERHEQAMQDIKNLEDALPDYDQAEE